MTYTFFSNGPRKVEAVEPHYVQTAKGLVQKEKFFLPRDLAVDFDGSTLWFNLEAGVEDRFRRATPPTEEEYAIYSVRNAAYLARLRSR